MGFWKFLAKKCFDWDKGSNKGAPENTVKAADEKERQEKIARHEGYIRGIHDKLSDQIREIGLIEEKLRNLLDEYDKASSAAKQTHKVRIRSLKKELDDMQELRSLHERNLEKEKLIVRKLKFNKELSAHEDESAAIEDIADETNEKLADLELEDRHVAELERTKYNGPKKRRTRDDASTEESEGDEDESLLARLRADYQPESGDKSENGDDEMAELREQLKS